MKLKLDTHNMQYNSETDKLIIPEYGRNVQMLIQHAVNIEDDALRKAFTYKIVDLIQQMHPQNRNVEDYKEKLWKHIFRISDYKIRVETPSGEDPRPEDYFKRPESIPYPNIDTRFRHYGHNVQVLIKKAIAMEEGSVKDGFIVVISSYMKLAYRTWNKDHYISDEIIKTDLELLSGGRLTLVENSSIDSLSNANRRRKRPTNDRNDRGDRHERGGRNNNRSNGGGRSNSRYSNDRNNNGRRNYRK